MPLPLAHGSISLRLYPHDLPPPELVAEVRAQAQVAEAAGFDGVMTSEHHGGFPNYLPNPLLMATWALDATTTLWAAPCPIILPLRPWTQVVEDIAWSAARFPGRVGAGFASGALPVDFELADVPFDEMGARFRAALPEVAAALGGRASGPLAGDPAVAALAGTPVPVVSAAQSPAAARRAARLDIGLLYDSISTIERTREVSDVHVEAGGTAPRILIRRVWIGPPPTSAVQAQMDRYRSYAPDRAKAHWGTEAGSGHLSADDGVELAERLHAVCVAGRCDTLNLRVFLAGMAPAEVRDQIERLGAETLPRLRALLTPAPSSAGGGA
jgi:alkanesulfonate monooxygenase SsuD/methylene tetrahydromethanopterin reductase-like flavin-dependent oxidoreductase (luciferase family)